MKTTEQFLSYLDSLDIKLWLDGDHLRCNAPKGKLSPEFKAELTERKAEILELIRNINQLNNIQEPIPQVSRESNLLISFAQERLWFLDRFEADSPLYNLPKVFRIKGILNVEALRQSLNQIIQRHEALRTSFTSVEGQPVQVITASLAITLPIVDLQDLPEIEQKAEVKRLIDSEIQQPFNLTQVPLLRTTLLRLSKVEHIVMFTIHHIVFDGWSMEILIQELKTFYEAFCRNQNSPLPELPIQYADFAVWQRQWLVGELFESQLSYWQKQLDGAPESLELPTDSPRPAVQSFKGANHNFELSLELSVELRNFSQQQGCTLFVTLLAAFKTLLYRYTNNNDMVVGSPIANRNHKQIEKLIGFFVNTLVLRTNLSGNPSFIQLLNRVRKVALGAYAHQDLPFEKVVEKLQPQRSLSYSPLFQVMFVLQNAQSSDLQLSDLTLNILETQNTTAMFDLTLGMEETESGLVGTFEYSTDLFKAQTIERMAKHLQVLLEAIIANPQQCLSELPILTESEQQLLFDWNNTQAEYSKDICIHSLFEEQVAKTPNAVAVVFEQQELTYQQLNQRANQLAHRLQTLGVDPEALVGICVERSLEMVVGLLGILKAGGAYVPLDPSYPRERLSYMLSNAGMEVLLTQESLLSSLPSHTARMVCLDTDWEETEQHSQENLIAEVCADNLALVIYTSGSTGQPKGVMISHSSIVNRLFWGIEQYKLKLGERVLQKTSLNFDASVWEIFGTLLAGSCLILARPDGHRDPAYLVKIMVEQRITHVDFVPAMLKYVLDESGIENCSYLRSVNSGGESLPLEIRDHFFEKLAGVELHNCYGPTEVSIDATSWLCDRNSPAISIGRPIANQEVYILDDFLQPVPIGVAGELYVGGAGLARGYLNQPDLTAEKFIPHPFNLHENARLYRTGDLARFLPDGNIQFLGRLDNQVKIRGIRLEIDEIAGVLRNHPTVNEAVVVMQNDSVSKRLVAYISPKQRGRQSQFWPSVGEYPLYDELLYHSMTNDEKRNQCYRQSIYKLVQDKVVMEIGTGQDAILARFCIEAGAKKVYAIESDKEAYERASVLVKRLGWEDKISLFQGYSTEIELPEHADVCLSEIIGTIGGSEGVAVILNDARRFLKPDGCMIPHRCSTKIAAVSLPHELLKSPGFKDVPAHYVRKIFNHVGNPFDIRLCVKNFPLVNIISNDDIFEDLDFSAYTAIEYERKINLQITKAGRFDGFILWLNLYTNPDIIIDNLKQEFSWLPVYFPVFSPGLEVLPGDAIIATCNGQLSDNNINPDYRISGRVIRQNGDVIHFAHDSYHHQSAFSRSPFFELLFPNDEISLITSERELSAKNLRTYLSQYLPNYMLPDAFVTLDALPLTPNGKVDKKALPIPDFTLLQSQEYVAPKNEVEEILSAIWTEVLGVNRIGVYDNFFELGGHSLLATQLMSRVRQTFGVEVPLKTLFEANTINTLAIQIQSHQADSSTIATLPLIPVDRAENLPLSFAQQRMWFFDRLEPNSSAYNMAGAVRLNGQIHVVALEKTFSEIIRRHEVLRTNFLDRDGQTVVQIRTAADVNLRLIDIRGFSHQADEIETLTTAEAQKPFDLTHDSLIRFTLIQVADTEYILLLTMHHIVSDGWSIDILVQEIATLYQAFIVDKPSPLPELEIQYVDFAVWQRQCLQEETLESHLNYWQQQLADVPTLLELPTDRPRPAVQSFDGASYQSVIPIKLAEAIDKLTQQEGVTLFMTLLAAFDVLLYRYTGQTDVLIGSPIANRNHAEIENLIGFFVNTLVLRNDLSGNPTFRELLQRVREVALEAYTYQDLPFEMLVETLQPERNLSHSPLFQVMFILQNTPMSDLELSGVTLSPVKTEGSVSTFDLTLELTSTNEGLIADWEYNTDLFDASTIARMAEHFEMLLTDISTNPDRQISHLSLLTTSEQQQLLWDWNDTQADYLQDLCIHQLFEGQVEKTPDAVALVSEDQQLSYRELNAKANQLAHYLKKLGVKSEVLVGICVERSLDMVIGLLAILKAGGAYLPLDCSYPQERLAFMLADANIEVLLIQKHLQQALPNYRGQIICLDDNDIWSRDKITNPISESKPENLAYVIYTSGSTGQPKGVMITRQNLLNFCQAAISAYEITSTDRILQFASVSFDVAAEEIYPGLIQGATIYLRTTEMLHSPSDFWQHCQAWELTLLDLPTAYWQQLTSGLVNSPTQLPASVRLMIIGGERANPVLVRLWQEQVGEYPQLINAYGPTETTVEATYCNLTNLLLWEGQEVLIGKPLANMQAYIFDAYLQLVPVGVSGELHIGGSGVANGYLNRPDLTAERFIPNPFGKNGDSRLYRTGDLAKYLPDGNIEYIGRIDHQVKLRGFRIELGEIEAVLRQHSAVQETVVVVREDNPNDKCLVAYLVIENSHETQELVGQIRSFLKEKLPQYMIPSAFVLLEELPLVPSGKIDRKALPQPDSSRFKPEETFVAPRSPLEEATAEIWSQVLNIKQIGIHDNFFDLGGHSLTATQLVSRLRDVFQVELPLRSIFESPTIAELAIAIVHRQIEQMSSEEKARFFAEMENLS